MFRSIGKTLTMLLWTLTVTRGTGMALKCTHDQFLTLCFVQVSPVQLFACCKQGLTVIGFATRCWMSLDVRDSSFRGEAGARGSRCQDEGKCPVTHIGLETLNSEDESLVGAGLGTRSIFMASSRPPRVATDCAVARTRRPCADATNSAISRCGRTRASVVDSVNIFRNFTTNDVDSSWVEKALLNRDDSITHARKCTWACKVINCGSITLLTQNAAITHGTWCFTATQLHYH